MSIIISGIQQLGVGVYDVYKAWDWYRDILGADVLLSDAPGEAALMLPYTDNKPQTRHTFLAFNMQGGGGFELWQYTSKAPKGADFDITIGDLGTFAGKIKSENIEAAYLKLKEKGVEILSPLEKGLDKKKRFFFMDMDKNIYQVVEHDKVFYDTNSKTGGIFGAFVGSTDIEKSKEFYKNILGYDTVIYDETGVFEDFKNLKGGQEQYRRVLLTHSKPRTGAFSKFFAESEIELVQAIEHTPRKIYENRLWGDPGFIQICFDVKNMKDVKEHCESFGVNFTTDSNPEAYTQEAQIFDMGGASGHFAYIEDPDGNLIEFVETYSIPIVEKLGIRLNLKKRSGEKALPNFVVKCLKFLRKDASYYDTDVAKAKLQIAKDAQSKWQNNQLTPNR